MLMDRRLQAALMDIVGMLNSPRYDDILLDEAGVSLDRALFPLLVRIDALGPISIAELADQVGRDHSTVSRQVAKLETLGFVARQTRADDQRIRAASITRKGKEVARTLAAARTGCSGVCLRVGRMQTLAPSRASTANWPRA